MKAEFPKAYYWIKENEMSPDQREAIIPVYTEFLITRKSPEKWSIRKWLSMLARSGMFYVGYRNGFVLWMNKKA